MKKRCVEIARGDPQSAADARKSELHRLDGNVGAPVGLEMCQISGTTTAHQVPSSVRLLSLQAVWIDKVSTNRSFDGSCDFCAHSFAPAPPDAVSAVQRASHDDSREVERNAHRERPCFFSRCVEPGGPDCAFTVTDARRFHGPFSPADGRFYSDSFRIAARSFALLVQPGPLCVGTAALVNLTSATLSVQVNQTFTHYMKLVPLEYRVDGSTMEVRHMGLNSAWPCVLGTASEMCPQRTYGVPLYLRF